jgi:hypothetical protein
MKEQILWGGITFVLWVVVFYTARKWAQRRKASRPPDAPKPIPKEWL